MQGTDIKEEISRTTGDRDNVYIEVIEVGQDKYSEQHHATGSPFNNYVIQEDICSKDTHSINALEQSHDSDKLNKRFKPTTNHESEQNESSVESIRTPDHSVNCRKTISFSVVSLCLVIVTGSIVGALFFYTKNSPPRIAENQTDVFVSNKDTARNCTKTSSNELFRPIKRYTDSDIQKYKTNRDILRNISYDLTAIKKNISYWKYAKCLSNPFASEKTKFYLTDYRIYNTILFFNGSNIHDSTIFAHVPMINVDCNFDVTQSSETVSFRHIKSSIEYLRRTVQVYRRKYNNTITLPPFTKAFEYLKVPGVTLIFPYTAVMQRYNRSILPETFQEGQVVVQMQLEKERILEYEFDSDYENCWN